MASRRLLARGPNSCLRRRRLAGCRGSTAWPARPRRGLRPRQRRLPAWEAAARGCRRAAARRRPRVVGSRPGPRPAPTCGVPGCVGQAAPPRPPRRARSGTTAPAGPRRRRISRPRRPLSPLVEVAQGLGEIRRRSGPGRHRREDARDCRPGFSRRTISWAEILQRPRGRRKSARGGRRGAGSCRKAATVTRPSRTSGRAAAEVSAKSSDSSGGRPSPRRR